MRHNNGSANVYLPISGFDFAPCPLLLSKKYNENAFNYNYPKHHEQQQQQRHLLIQTSTEKTINRRSVQKLSASYFQCETPAISTECDVSCQLFTKNTTGVVKTQIIAPLPRPSILEIESDHYFVEESRQRCNFGSKYCQRQIYELETLCYQQCEQNEILKHDLENSNDYSFQLLQSVESLLQRLVISEHQVNKQINHIETLYYTMYKYGFDKLHMQNGDCINLKDFRGKVLKLARQDGECVEENDLNRKKEDDHNGRSKQDYSNDTEKILRKITRLQLERNKIDDYLAWLHNKAKNENYRHNIFATKNHIYDEPYTESSSDCEYDGEDGPHHMSVKPSKRVQYSDSQMMKTDGSADWNVQQIRRSSGDKETNRLTPFSKTKTESPKPKGSSSPQRRIRNNRSRSPSSKKRRFSRRESFFVNLLEKQHMKRRRHSLNPFFLGRSHTLHNTHNEPSTVVKTTPQRKLKIHII